MSFESFIPLFDPTVRHFLVPHDLNEFEGMKCALLATHTLEHTMTAAFYCPARVCGWDLIDISIRDKQWVLYHNMHQVNDQIFDVVHGDYFALFEKLPNYGSKHPVPTTNAPVVSQSWTPAELDPYLTSGYSEMGNSDPPYCPFAFSGSQRMISPPVGAGRTIREQHDLLSACAGCPRDSHFIGVTNTYGMTDVVNYAESTPYDLQAELDDASVASEGPNYGCDVTCLYCSEPCVRTKFGHTFHQCPEHYRWWRHQSV